MSETEGNHSMSGSGSSTTELGVSEASLELAERVALRLDIYDKPAIFNMLSSRAKLVLELSRSPSCCGGS